MSEKKSWWKYIISFFAGIGSAILTFFCFHKHSSSGDINRGFDEVKTELNNIEGANTEAEKSVDRARDTTEQLKTTTEQLESSIDECTEIVDKLTK